MNKNLVKFAFQLGYRHGLEKLAQAVEQTPAPQAAPQVPAPQPAPQAPAPQPAPQAGVQEAQPVRQPNYSKEYVLRTSPRRKQRDMIRGAGPFEGMTVQERIDYANRQHQQNINAIRAAGKKMKWGGGSTTSYLVSSANHRHAKLMKEFQKQMIGGQ